MKKEFVLRGQTPDAGEEVLNFSGHKKGYAYKMTEFKLYPSSAIGTANDEMSATISAGKTGIDPTAPNFNDEALVATALSFLGDGPRDGPTDYSVINETFLITQNLILKVKNTNAGSPINWQCKFESVKMSKSQEAVTNYKQFMISDD